ncbi:hypothetical protein SY83_13180 [Paenibacillus swuensis]|uniref:Glycosyltransferase 2-like domain-containing protein n=1 Tax=Paenibacillus swuensis TaxID=1178515 RepID=A0A172TJ19_9BACL|nr:glycosyltransferase family 2 protein [Paenibacillus swuensis]ANE47059.1 hypothetical protein SY83_13180 [Paenibacillus swuensis]
MKLSVHIVTYNSAEDINDCLQAVFKQTYPIREIIIIDNASTDGTKEQLQKYRERCRVSINSSNVGFAQGHNQAIQLSNADYYLVLNPDVVLHPDYLYHLMKIVENNPAVGSLTGKLLSAEHPDLIDSTGLDIKASRRCFDRGQGQPEANFNEPAEVFGVSGAAALYSRAMVEDISWKGEFFDETFFAYKEDIDVAWRAQIRGWTSRYVPEATAHHERGWKPKSRNSRPLFIRKYSYINRYQMMLKNESPLYMLRGAFRILPFEIASFGYMLLKEPQVLGAWVDLVRNIPEILEKRRHLMRGRKRGWKEIYRFFT